MEKVYLKILIFDLMQWGQLTTDYFPFAKGITVSSTHVCLQYIIFVKTTQQNSNRKKYKQISVCQEFYKRRQARSKCCYLQLFQQTLELQHNLRMMSIKYQYMVSSGACDLSVKGERPGLRLIVVLLLSSIMVDTGGKFTLWPVLNLKITSVSYKVTFEKIKFMQQLCIL